MAKMISRRGLGDGGAIVSCCSQVVQEQEQEQEQEQQKVYGVGTIDSRPSTN